MTVDNLGDVLWEGVVARRGVTRSIAWRQGGYFIGPPGKHQARAEAGVKEAARLCAASLCVCAAIVIAGCGTGRAIGSRGPPGHSITT